MPNYDLFMGPPWSNHAVIFFLLACLFVDALSSLVYRRRVCFIVHRRDLFLNIGFITDLLLHHGRERGIEAVLQHPAAFVNIGCSFNCSEREIERDVVNGFYSFEVFSKCI